MSGLATVTGRVLVTGDIMTDIVVRTEGPAVPGSDRRALISMVDGGSAANQAAWLAASGVPVALFARVGMADRDGVAARLAADGIAPLVAGDAEHGSGRLVTLLDPGGERSFFTDRGANLALSINDLPDNWRDGTGLLVLSGYSFFVEGPRACVMAMIAAAREKSIPVVIDAASVGFLAECGAEAFLTWTAGTDLIVANTDEAALMTGKSGPAEQLAGLLDAYPMAVIKRGAEGSLGGIRGAEPVFAAGSARDAIDTTGAGDAFLAGFISAWRQGGDLGACLDAGNRLGAEAVARIGGRPQRTREASWSGLQP